MATIRGCTFPDELYYWVEKHVWVCPPDAQGLVRMGITASGFKLAGGRIVAITGRTKNVGQAITRGKPVAMLESSKYVGAIPAPMPGVLLAVNPAVVADPGLANRDPYGEGWIAEMRPLDWEAGRSALLTGAPADQAWRNLMEEENISCE